MQTTDTKRPSFFVFADAVACAQNKHCISVFNPVGSAYVLRLRRLELVNLALTAVTGVAIRADLNFISALSAGTDLTPRPHDSATPVAGNTPAGLLCKTGGTATNAYTYSAIALNNDEVLATGQQTDYQTMNLLPNDDALQALTLRAGEGFSVQQITSSAVGSFGWLLHFTSEPLV